MSVLRNTLRQLIPSSSTAVGRGNFVISPAASTTASADFAVAVICCIPSESRREDSPREDSEREGPSVPSPAPVPCLRAWASMSFSAASNSSRVAGITE